MSFKCDSCSENQLYRSLLNENKILKEKLEKLESQYNTLKREHEQLKMVQESNRDGSKIITVTWEHHGFNNNDNKQPRRNKMNDNKPKMEGTINFHIRTSFTFDEIKAHLKALLMKDKVTNKDYTFIIDELEFRGVLDGDNMLILCHGKLIDREKEEVVEIDYLIDDDAKFVLTGIDVDEKVEGSPLEWCDMGFIEMKLAEYNGVEIPWYGTRCDYGDGLYIELETNLDNIGTISELDKILFMTKENLGIVKYVEETMVHSRSGNKVVIKVTKGKLVKMHEDIPVFEGFLENVSQYKCIGIVTSTDAGKGIKPIACYYYGKKMRMGHILTDRFAIGLWPADEDEEYTPPRFFFTVHVDNDNEPGINLKTMNQFVHISGIIINLNGLHHYITRVKIDEQSGSKGEYAFTLRPVEMMSEGRFIKIDSLTSGDIVIRDFTFDDTTDKDFKMTIKKVTMNGTPIKIQLDKGHSAKVDYIDVAERSRKLSLEHKYPTISMAMLVRGDIKNLDNILAMNIEVGGHYYTASEFRTSIKSAFAEEDGTTRVLFEAVTVTAKDYTGFVDPRCLYHDNPRILCVAYMSTDPDFHATYLRADIDGIEADISCLKEEQEEPKKDIDALAQLFADAEKSGKLKLSLKIVEDPTNIEFYQVRGISVKEFGDSSPLSFKEPESTVKIINNHPEQKNKCENICSELVVPNGCYISRIMILDGGHVTVEEGGRVGKVDVYSGGELELCEGAIVNIIYELGGAVCGNIDRARFAANYFLEGTIKSEHHATAHGGTVACRLHVFGKLSTNENSHSDSLIIEDGGEVNFYGGYHRDLCVKKGGTVYIVNGVVDGIIAEDGSRVVIFSDAKVFDGEFHGHVEFNGDDFKKSPNIVKCESEEFVQPFKVSEQILDDPDTKEIVLCGDEE